RNVARLRGVADRAGLLGRKAPHILDIGCGDGTRLSYWARVFSGAQTAGCDLSASAITVARARGHDAKHCAYQQLEYPEGAADVVQIADVIEHVPEPVELLRAA